MEQFQKKKAAKIDVLSILALLIVARISCPALSNIPIFSMAFTFIYGATFVFIYMFTEGKIKKKDLTHWIRKISSDNKSNQEVNSNG